MINFLKPFLFVFIVVLITSCKDDDEPVPVTNQSPSVKVVGTPLNLSVKVGEDVTLDGSGSSDPEKKPLTFKWEIISQPQGSAVVLTSTTTDKITFKPTHEGSYKLKLTVSDGETSSSLEVNIIVTASDVQFPLTISEDVNTDVTWKNINPTPGEADYIVTKSINIRARLTVEPGVTVQMTGASQLTVDYTGKFIAIGNEQNHIIFKGGQSTAPSWAGIIVNSPSIENEFNYVEVRQAGSGLLEGLTNLSASLGIDDANNSVMKVKNTTIADGGGYGIYVEKNASLTEASQVTISGNAGTSIALPISEIGNVQSENSFTGNNGYNAVEIIGSLTLNQDEVVWHAFSDGTPYYISGNLDIRSGLKIQEGVSMEFAAGIGVNVLDANAYINAIGTADKKIKFSGRTPTKGFWSGISISSSNVLNTLEFVEISDAGSGMLPNISGITGSLGLDGGNLSSLTIKNSVITNGKGYGLYAELGSVIASFSNNAIRYIDGAPLALPANEVGKLDAATSFSAGNTTKTVEILGSVMQRAEEARWKAFTDGTKYFVSGNVEIRSGLVIDPGAVFEFAAEKMFIVQRINNSYIIAKGSTAKKITFTGVNKTQGYWGGIAIISNDDRNEFDFVDIAYGGGVFLTGLTNTKANLGLDGSNSAKLILKNSTLSNSGGWGLAKEPGATMNGDFKTANTFTSNMEGTVKE